MKKLIIGFLLFYIGEIVLGQNIVRYNFNNCNLSENNNAAGPLKNSVSAVCDCGIEGDALSISGQDIEFPIELDSFFKNDFTMCISLLLDNPSGEMDIISKTFKCNADTTLSISYRASDSFFIFSLREGFNESVFLAAKADPHSCWQTICLTKQSGDFRAFVNGIEKDRKVINELLRLNHGEPLRINNSPCQPNLLNGLRGRIDQCILADFAFDGSRIKQEYVPQQKILTQDTLIFLGDQFQLRAASNCPGTFQWSPNTGLSTTNSLNPIANPTQDIRYSLSFQLPLCRITDTVLVRVIDKDKVQCEEIRLPSAFTPNGDGLNDTYHISNNYLVDQLEYFDILDRNGGLLFSTNDPNLGWDGYSKGKALVPGTYYYRIAYQCKGNQFKTKGSFFLMK